MLMEKRDQLGRMTGPSGIYSLSDDEILERWHRVLSDRLREELEDPVLEADLGQVCAAMPGALASFQHASAIADRAAEYVALTERMFRKDGKLTATFAGSAAPRDLAPIGSRL